MANIKEELLDAVQEVQQREVLFSADKKFNNDMYQLKQLRGVVEQHSKAINQLDKKLDKALPSIFENADKVREDINKAAAGYRVVADKDGHKEKQPTVNQTKLATVVNEIFNEPKKFGKTTKVHNQTLSVLEQQQVPEQWQTHAKERASAGKDAALLSKQVAKQAQYNRSLAKRFGKTDEFNDYIKAKGAAEKGDTALFKGYEAAQDKVAQLVGKADANTIKEVEAKASEAAKREVKIGDIMQRHALVQSVEKARSASKVATKTKSK